MKFTVGDHPVSILIFGDMGRFQHPCILQFQKREMLGGVFCHLIVLAESLYQALGFWPNHLRAYRHSAGLNHLTEPTSS